MAQYNLSEIIDEFLAEQGLPDNMWNRCYVLGTTAMRELSMDMSAIPKSVTIPIDFETSTAKLPTDFLNYLSINLIGQNGLLFGLGLNNQLNLTSYFNNCGQPIRKPIPPPSLGEWQGQLANPTYLANHYRNGENVGAYFNAGGENNVGSYRINYDTNQIFIACTRLQGSSIVLEYIADINADDNDYQVHPFLIETIKDFIYWKKIQRDRNYGIGDKQMAEQSYKASKRHAMHRFNNMTSQQLIDSMRRNNKGIPKW